MEDEIDAMADAGAGFRIFDGALDEVDAGEVFKIGALAGDEVIDAADRGALGEQSARAMLEPIKPAIPVIR